MLTTLGERIRAAFKREPIAFCLVAFVLLTGAATGMTARQIFTAAPGAVNLGGVAASEGTSTALARADHVHSVATPAVLLQPSLPGTLQTGNINISGGMNLNGTLFSQNQTASIGYSANSTDATWFYTSAGGKANPAHDWQVVSSANQTANGALYRWRTAGASTVMEVNKDGRLRVGDGSIGGGIESLNGPLYLQRQGGFTGDMVVVDTEGFTTAGTNKLLSVKNNGVTKFSVDGNGNIVFAGSLSGTMTKVGSGSVTLAALSVAGSACAYDVTTLTVTGAVTSDLCSAVYVTGLGAGTALSMACEITASNTVSFRFCNHTSSSVGIPVAQSYIAYVMR